MSKRKPRVTPTPGPEPRRELDPAARERAQVLRRLREMSGLTQERMAEQLGVAQSTISEWEREEKPMPEGFLEARLPWPPSETPHSVSYQPDPSSIPSDASFLPPDDEPARPRPTIPSVEEVLASVTEEQRAMALDVAAVFQLASAMLVVYISPGIAAIIYQGSPDVALALVHVGEVSPMVARFLKMFAVSPWLNLILVLMSRWVLPSLEYLGLGPKMVSGQAPAQPPPTMPEPAPPAPPPGQPFPPLTPTA